MDPKPIALDGYGTEVGRLPRCFLIASASLAGSLAQQHAENLTSFVLAATVRPGAPVTYCSRIGPIDLRTAISAWGGPEVGMSGACAAQLAHRLGLPCDAYGFASSSPFLDPQFAYERLANALVPTLAGVDLLSGIGMSGDLVGGFEVSVIDDEIAGMIEQIVSGCEVSDETLAYDVMAEVIPRDGVFLGEMHTVRHMRQGALWMPKVSVRSGVSGRAEEHGLVERAIDRAREILRTHQVEPLADDVSRHLDEIVARARRELLTG